MKDWSEITVKTSESLEAVIKVLHAGGQQIALVVDKNGRLLMLNIDQLEKADWALRDKNAIL